MQETGKKVRTFSNLFAQVGNFAADFTPKGRFSSLAEVVACSTSVHRTDRSRTIETRRRLVRQSMNRVVALKQTMRVQGWRWRPPPKTTELAGKMRHLWRLPTFDYEREILTLVITISCILRTFVYFFTWYFSFQVSAPSGYDLKARKRRAIRREPWYSRNKDNGKQIQWPREEYWWCSIQGQLLNLVDCRLPIR